MSSLALKLKRLTKAVCCLSLICLPFVISYAKNTSQENLQQIKSQIQSIKSNLVEAQATRSTIQTDFKQTELDIGQISTELKHTRQQLTEQKQKLAALQQQQARYQDQLSQQQQALAAQLRGAYMSGREQYLKILFSQQNPGQVNRMLMYYRYFIQSRTQLVNNMNQTLQALAQNEVTIQNQISVLQQTQAKQQQQASQLKSTKQKRAHLLQQINADIQTKSQKLAVLMANKQALEQVVRQLQTQSIHYQPPAGISLTAIRGKLLWPTTGKVIQNFGAAMEQSQLKSTGVVIAAPAGQGVYAIAPGRVVYSNWLAGYGLLIIIDHGHGVMSLYGRNNSLYKKVGDDVQTGELIASVGRSGGYTMPSLYFAIRVNGAAVDPLQWCRNHASQPRKRRA